MQRRLLAFHPLGRGPWQSLVPCIDLKSYRFCSTVAPARVARDTLERVRPRACCRPPLPLPPLLLLMLLLLLVHGGRSDHDHDSCHVLSQIGVLRGYEYTVCPAIPE